MLASSPWRPSRVHSPSSPDGWPPTPQRASPAALRDFLFDHIQRLSFSYHSRTPTGDLIERVTSDVDSLRKFFSEQAIGIGRIILLFGINWAAILSLNTRLGWLSVVVIPVILLVSLWFFGQVTKRYEQYQAQEAILSTTLQENLTGVRVVKAFARQEYEKGKFEKDNWSKYLKGRLLLLMHSLFWPLSDIVLGFQMLFGFIFAANMVISGEMTIGNYLTYVGLVVWLIWPIRNLGRMIVQTSTGMVSFGRLLEIAKQTREPLTDGRIHPDGPLQGDVRFENVTFTYSDGNTEVLRGLSFHIHPDNRWPSWAQPAQARHRSSTCCPASTNTRPAASCWMASNCGTTPGPTCARRSGLCSRSRSCSVGRFATTSSMAWVAPSRRKKWNAPPGRRPSTT